jgi:acyl-CoA thioesterase
MHPFDEDLALTPLEPSVYQGRVTGNWGINGIPNGGYLMALLAHAMMLQSEKKLPLIVTVTYYHRCRTGEARITAENIACSRRFDRWHATLSQEGRERIRAMGTFTEEGSGKAHQHYEKPEPDVAALEECVELPSLHNFPLMDRVDIRLDPSCAGWLSGGVSERSEMKGWVKFQEDRAFDALAVLLMADCFPPPIFTTHGPLAWVPTIEFTVNIRNIPSTPWLKCAFRTSFVNGDILEADGEVWDGKGELIAISRQIAQLRMGSV